MQPAVQVQEEQKGIRTKSLNIRIKRLICKSYLHLQKRK